MSVHSNWMWAAALAVSCLLVGPALAEDGTATQAVFLICPHQEKYSAWSLYLTLDAKDKSKIISMGLETLKKQNSKSSSYEAVLKAQSDSATEREKLGTLEVAQFGKKELKVEKQDALHVSVESAENGAYHLNLSMRVGASDRFVIGGKERKKNDVVLKFDKATNTWGAFAATLTDGKTKKKLEVKDAPMSGIVFPVKETGIYSVVGVVNGSETVTLMDRSWSPDGQ